MSRPIRTTIGLGVAAVTVLAASGAGLTSVAAAAPSTTPTTASTTAHHAAAAATSSLPTINITIGGKKGLQFSASGLNGLTAGPVAMHVRIKKGLSEGEAEILSFHKGYSYNKWLADLTAFYSSDQSQGSKNPTLKNLRRADHRSTEYGGVDLQSGRRGTATFVLPAGTYYLLNESSENGPSSPTKFRVGKAAGSRSVPASDATVKAVTGDRFGGAKTLPRQGRITFMNTTKNDEHFLGLSRVKDGTTHKQIAAYLTPSNASAPPPSWVRKAYAGTEIVDPGHSQTLSYTLPKGEYVELCFQSDESNGMPHAYMGMYRIVHLV